MGTDYAFIVAASENYLFGITAMFNSLEDLNNKHDLFLLSYNLPQSFLNSLSKYSFHIKIIKSDNNHQITATAIDRFKLAYELMPDRKAICLLDADMFFLSSVDLFFDIASKGFVVTGSNGMMINFNIKYQKQYKIDLGSENYPYLKTHTTVPIFINQDNIHWFQELFVTRPGFDQWDDFLYLNILGIKLGIDKKMLCMPPYYFTGIHHWLLKPVIQVMQKGEYLVSGTEQPIYIVHGKWFDEGWYKDLSIVMDRYFENEDFGEKQKQESLKSRKILFDKFVKYLNNDLCLAWNNKEKNGYEI